MGSKNNLTIMDVLQDPALLGSWFRGDSWYAWQVFLKVLFGLELTAEERQVFQKYTKRNLPPDRPPAEGWVVAGRRGGKSLIAALVATYLACFTIYTILPVLGPRIVAAATEGGSGGGGLVAGLAEGLRQAGDVPGTAFPSSHCAGALAAALAAGEFVSRRLRAVLVAWAVLVSVSTVYTGNHYALDAVAGVILTLGVRFVLTRSYAVRRPRTGEVLS